MQGATLNPTSPTRRKDPDGPYLTGTQKKLAFSVMVGLHKVSIMVGLYKPPKVKGYLLSY